MSKKEDHIEDYPLFYEEIGRLQQDRSSGHLQADTAYERTGGLNDEQLAKLSEDLQSPLKNHSGDSNPLK